MRSFSGFIPATNARNYTFSQALKIGDNQNFWIGVLFTSAVPFSATGLAYTSAGGGPYTVTVTMPSTATLNGVPTVTVSNGSDPDVNGVQTITVVNATTFTFSLVADPGASGTLDIAYVGASLAGTLILQASDNESDWWDITGSSQAVTAATRHSWNVSEAHYPLVRVGWTYTSGDGNISGRAIINEQLIARGA